MSTQDVRCPIILENVPKLIESLTGLKPTDAKFAPTVHWALATIRSHKFLSVNGHEVQRRLDNLAERFGQANYEPFAVRLSELCERLCKSPICLEHYETDIHWAVLNFMLEIARNPVAGLAQNRGRIALIDAPLADGDEEAVRREANCKPAALVAELLEANFATLSPAQAEGNDELSDWSDSDNDDDVSDENDPRRAPKAGVVQSTHEPSPSTRALLPGIKPPEPQPYFTRFDEGCNSKDWLSANIQPSWWLDDTYVHPSISQHPEAQFCATWSKLVAQANGTAANQAPLVPAAAAAVSTISEYGLLREILWLFSEPVACKLFTIDTQTDSIACRPNVSLNSTSVPALQAALQHFMHYATICMRLRRFCDAVDRCAAVDPAAPSAPHTYECYAQAVRQCLQPMATFVRRTERDVVAQRPDTLRPQTLVRLHRDLEPYTAVLDALHEIHAAATLDFRRQPAHICATHLVAGLLRAHESAAGLVQANLAAALLIGSLRVYMQIIDTWWTDGRLEDWREEFLIKSNGPQAQLATTTVPGGGYSSPNHSDEFEMRLLSPNAERSFYLSRAVADTIDTCPLIKMLCAHSMQAGHTLNVLYELDRIGEVKSQCGYQENLFETFWHTTMNKLMKLQRTESDVASSEATVDSAPHDKTSSAKSTEKRQQVAQFRSHLLGVGGVGGDTSAALLALVFEPSLRRMDVHDTPQTIDAYDAYALYERLTALSDGGCMLPVGDAVSDTLAALLTARIAVANRCVIRMYRDEFQVLAHLRNLRRVFLLEASDLMFQFYTTLFRQIERSDRWNNPYLLTDTLNAVLCTKYPDMCRLFAVQVSARRFVSRNVLDALRNVSLRYAVAPCLRDIISPQTLRCYNEIFRLLLRLKWGMWTLEQLRFPVAQKRRPAYARQTYHDRTFKRLALVRIWILYSMQCVHSHVMTHVVQVLGVQLDERVAGCRTLSELCAVHGAFVRTVHEYCFLQGDDRNILMGVEQLLTLICVVRNEWRDLEGDGDQEEDDMTDAVEGGERSSQIEAIEISYISCHTHITAVLNTQLYTKNREHLASLAAAFSHNAPY